MISVATYNSCNSLNTVVVGIGSLLFYSMFVVIFVEQPIEWTLLNLSAIGGHDFFEVIFSYVSRS